MYLVHVVYLIVWCWVHIVLSYLLSSKERATTLANAGGRVSKKTPTKSLGSTVSRSRSVIPRKKPSTTLKKQLRNKVSRSIPGPEPFNPRKFQEEGIKFGLKRATAGFFWDPGLGKTTLMLAIYKVLKKKKLIDHCLVIAPRKVATSVWNKLNPDSDLNKFTDFSRLTTCVLRGSLKNLEQIDGNHDLYVMNPEGLDLFVEKRSKVVKVRGRKQTVTEYHFTAAAKRTLSQLGNWMLVVDESHKFKNYSSDRSKRLWQLRKLFSRIYLLTGSPQPNSLEDLFGQVLLLDGGATLGRFITHYRNKYFYSTGFMGKSYEPREGAKEEIYKAIAPLVHRQDADDVMDLPKLVTVDHWIDLPPTIREMYDELEEQFILELEGGKVVASNAGVATSKLRQLANGGVYLSERGRPVKHLHTEKIDVVVELLEELKGSATLVAYDTRHDLERLQQALGKNTPYLGGGVTDKRALEIEAQWNRGIIDKILGHPTTVAHGMNLQLTGKAVIWHSLTYRYDEYDQYIRRIRRQGVKVKRVLNHRVLARNTVDEVIVKILDKKARNQNALFQALKAYYL